MSYAGIMGIRERTYVADVDADRRIFVTLILGLENIYNDKEKWHGCRGG